MSMVSLERERGYMIIIPLAKPRRAGFLALKGLGLDFLDVEAGHNVFRG